MPTSKKRSKNMPRLDDFMKELDFSELDRILAQMDFTDFEIESFDDLEIESFDDLEIDLSFADTIKKDDLEEKTQ